MKDQFSRIALTLAALLLAVGSGAAHAQISHIASSSVETSSTTHQITLPDPITENDIVVIGIGVDTKNVTLDAGLTEIATATNTDVRPKLAYFISDGTEGGTAIGGTTTTSDIGFVGYSIFRGVDTTTPIDATAVTNTGTSTNITMSSIDTNTNGAWVLAFSSVDRHRVQTLDASLTSLWNQTGNTTGVGGALGYESIATAGASGTYTNTLNTTDEEWAAITAALRPAPAGGASATVLRRRRAQ